MKTVRVMAVVLSMALIGGGASSSISAQPPAQATPPLVIKSMSGRDLYQFYCASCHGCDAKGAGPVASALKTPPADLTRLTAGNGGVLPRDEITASVSGGGRAVPAHGSRDMPVWGPIFRGLDSRTGYDRTRIANIVRYIESIQAKPPPDDCR